MATGPTNSHTEARRLLSKGFRLCTLHANSKQPFGDDWNVNLLTRPEQVADSHGGFGMPLAANGLCSVDFDNAPVAEIGLLMCGFDIGAIRAAGVATSSTRPGSGGRVAFRVPAGANIRWLRFTNREDGTILELRATSANLQDCLPGTVYSSADGTGPWRQDYAGQRRFDDAPELPADLLAWWERLSNDLDFLHDQQLVIGGPQAQRDVSSGSTLAYSSVHRADFNRSHSVEDMLREAGYSEHRNGRFAPPTATGAPSVRRIPDKEDLWRSDHASDPLFGNFDAWTAFVVLSHGQDQEAAEAACSTSRAVAVVEGFEDLDVPVTRIERLEPLADGADTEADFEMPAFERNKQGKIKPILNNVLAALRRPALTGVDIGLDSFRDEVMIAPAGTARWRTFTDGDYVSLRSHLESAVGGIGGFDPIGRELIRDAVLFVAEEHRFDSAMLWLDGLVWDGVPRIDTFFSQFFSAEDSPYARSVSAYLWTALAGRVLDPGCQADMVPILVGDQGLGKSTAVKALVPSMAFFTEVSFSEKEDDLSRRMRGKLIAEIGELRGLHSRELESIKAFITRTHENWVPKYREFQTTFPRRLVFVGTTNKDQFLADDTGNRRWLPLRVGTVDVARVRAAAEQCWAEAATRFRLFGIEWQDASRLAGAVHKEFEMHDEWEEKVLAWVNTPLFEGEQDGGNAAQPLLTSDVLRWAIGMEGRQVRRADEMRMASVLKKLGYERKRISINGEQRWRFCPPGFDLLTLT